MPHLAPALTFTGPALMELEREDDVILILTELTDEALGLAELGRKGTGSKMRDNVSGSGTEREHKRREGQSVNET